MTIVNSKFVSVDIVLANLGRAHKRVNWDMNDVLEWCMQIETEMIADVDSMCLYEDIRLKVTNKQAPVPCNLHRILDVYTDPNNPLSKVSYFNTGAYLNFNSDFNSQYVYISYYGTTIDLASGAPLILRTHLKACEAYCVQQAYYEKYLNNEINGQQWSVIDQRVSEGCNIAITQGVRFKDRQDLTNLNIIKGNMITKIGLTTLYKDGIGE
jgi:hypothetical protein